MATLPTSIQTRVDKILRPGEKVVKVYSSSCSKTGGPGESWLIVTKDRVIIGNQSLTSDVEFADYPLEKITGIERDGHGLGSGAIYLVANVEKLDQFAYTLIDSDAFLNFDQELPTLIRKTGVRPVAPVLQPEIQDEKTLAPKKTPDSVPIPTKPARKPTTRTQSKEPKAAPQPVVPPKTRIEKAQTAATAERDISELLPSSKAATPSQPVVTSQKPSKPTYLLERINGKGNKNMQIFLPEPPYLSGDRIDGRVSLKVGAGSGLSTRGVRFQVTGIEKTSVTKGSGNSSSTFTERHTIVEEETVLLGVGTSSFMDSFEDAFAYLTGSKKALKIPGGNHEWSVSFDFPKDAPPSFKGRYAKIVYAARAYVDVPLGFDVIKTVELPVLSPRNSQEFRFVPLNKSGEGILRMNLTQPDILLRAKVNDFVWNRDSTITGAFSFENPAQKKIRGVCMKAYYLEQAHPKGVRAEHVYREKRNYAKIEFSGKSFGERQFKITVPAGPPPFKGKCVKVDLMVEVSLDIPICPDFKLLFVAESK